jgi:hypothetical protein
VDYTAPASVTIPAGATGVDVPVTIVNDVIFEGTETITFEFRRRQLLTRQPCQR